MTRCAVLGSPIEHSLSPVLHRAAYDVLRLAWTYEAIEVVPEGLGDFLEGLDDEEWRGLSLTMPLKRTVVPLLDSLDEHAGRARAANTVLLTGERRVGFNTDVPGAVAAMAERLGGGPVASAVVLGGGATAASMILALADRGCTTARVVVREEARADETVAVVAGHPRAPEIEVTRLGDLGTLTADLVVSTVPAEAQIPQVVAACATIPAVFDVVYDPWPTPLAKAAEDTGRTLVTGLDLLAHQAALQVQIMTGGTVAVDLLRDAGREELARRAVESGPSTPPAP